MKRFLFILIMLSLFTGCHESLEKRAAREAREFTQKSCPTPVVDNVRTDSLAFEPQTRTLHYYYSLCNRADDPRIVSAKRKELHESLLQSVKNSPQIKAYKDAGFSFCYTYYSSGHPGKILFETRFTPKDYR